MSDGSRRFSIGRNSGCDVVLADDTVAPVHAWLDFVPGRPLIVSAEPNVGRTEVVHDGRARAIRKGIVTAGDLLRLGEVEIPVDEVLVALKLREGAQENRGDAPPAQDAGRAPVAAQPKPDVRQHGSLPRAKTPDRPTPAAPKPVDAAANQRPLTRSLILPCPACGKPTSSLKRHRLYRLLVFVGVAYWAQTAEYTACPACMRQVILTRTLVNIPTANVTWPILFVIHAFHFAGTFRAGHSGKVLELIR